MMLRKLWKRFWAKVDLRRGWAPDGQVYVCPQCQSTSLERGYCLSDGTLMELRPRPRCPNGHYLFSIRYPVVAAHCPECGVKTR